MTQSILQSYYLSSFLFIFLNPLHRFLEALIRLISESFEPIAPILFKITFYWPASATPSVLQTFLLSSILNLYLIPLVRLFQNFSLRRYVKNICIVINRVQYNASKCVAKFCKNILFDKVMPLRILWLLHYWINAAVTLF